MISKVYQNRLKQLKEKLLGSDYDGWIVTGEDAHASEYPAKCYNDREWLTGFSGSAGLFLALKKSDGNVFFGFWTDARYHLEAATLFQNSEIQFFPEGKKGILSLIDYLKQELFPNNKVGVDGATISVQQFEKWKRNLKSKEIQLASDFSFLYNIENYPIEKGPFFQPFELPEPFATKTILERIETIRKKMKKLNQQVYFFSALDQIAWLLNLRGKDIDFNPIFYSWFILTEDRAILFLHQINLNFAIKRLLDSAEIKLCAIPSDFKELTQICISQIGMSELLIDPVSFPIALKQEFEKMGVNVLVNHTLNRQIAEMKACRDVQEIKWIQLAMEADCLALMRLERKISALVDQGEVFYETDVSKWSTELRAQAASEVAAFHQLKINNGLSFYLGLSFDTIAGYGSNGAVIHYRPTKGSALQIGKEFPLLLDSGGQYLFGTTDITRVWHFGEPSKMQKEVYTNVVKGHFQLSDTIFPKGTLGSQLDSFARLPLWQSGRDYPHGTGHGVGFVLNVHEGPQSISPSKNFQPLLEGMVISNEPGCYLEGDFGIRFEGLVCVVPKNNLDNFFGFKSLSLYPVEKKLLDLNRLSDVDRTRINKYHQNLFQKMNSYLTEDEKEWLAKKCEKLGAED